MTIRFPRGFDWGTATAAHQIEGGNWNNDWWVFEHTEGTVCRESSGDACDSWNRWDADVALVQALGLSSYRFSIEWSRIEPEPGEWSGAAIAHYRRLGELLLAAGVDPIVTFHHFTTPRWVDAEGGWLAPSTPARFAAFCERAASELAPVLRRACTINEPNIVAAAGFLIGVFPPGHRDVEERRTVNGRFVDAHRQAVDAIRRSTDDVPVGLTLAMEDYQAVAGGESRRDRVQARMHDEFLDAVEGDDFLGVQAYTGTVFDGTGPVVDPDARVVTSMGYEFHPAALGASVRYAWERTRGQVPLYVTENGIGTDDDAERVEYVRGALEGLADAMADGIDVRGYTYWSLLDNFEWALGYVPRFGLHEVDRTTFERTPKPSAAWYAAVVEANALTDTAVELDLR